MKHVLYIGAAVWLAFNWSAVVTFLGVIAAVGPGFGW